MLNPNLPGAKANSQWRRHIGQFKMATMREQSFAQSCSGKSHSCQKTSTFLWFLTPRTSDLVWTFQYLLISVIVHVPALLTHPPSHLQRTVQCTVALEHLQFPVQDTSQPQRNRTEQALLLSSRVVQNGSHSPVLVFCQPQSWKSGVSSWTEVACLQKKQVCSSALRMC